MRSLAAAVPEARSLTHLLLRGTGLLDEGATALAVALMQPRVSAGAPTTTSSSNTPTSASSSDAAATATAPAAAGAGAASSASQQEAASATNNTNNSNNTSSSPPNHVLQVLDLSQNVICDTGAEQLAAAVQAPGVLPRLQQLVVVDNRYPFDWATVLQLQGLQVLRPGLRVNLGAPSSWCVAPSAVSKGGRLAAAAAAAATVSSSSSAAVPAGWTSAAPEALLLGGSAAEGTTEQEAGSSSSAAAAEEQAAGEALSIASEDLCGVCLDAPNALFVNSCRHQLCIDCYKQLVKAAAAAAAASGGRRQLQSTSQDALGCAACPFCRAPMTGFRYSAWVHEEEQEDGGGADGAAEGV